MAIRNHHDDYGWAMPRNAQGEGRPKGLHNYRDEPDDPLKLSLKDTLIELTTTLGGIAAVIFVIIELANFFHLAGPQ